MAEEDIKIINGFTIKHIDQTLFIYMIEDTDDVSRIKGWKQL